MTQPPHSWAARPPGPQKAPFQSEDPGEWFNMASPSLVPQMVKNPPAVRETQVPSLGQEEPLEKGMASHPSITAWRIPRTEKPGGLQSRGTVAETAERLTLSLPTGLPGLPLKGPADHQQCHVPPLQGPDVPQGLGQAQEAWEGAALPQSAVGLS